MRKKGTTNMPKMKTKQAAAKRLKVTGTGKLMGRSGWKRHLLEAKSPKRRRKLRGPRLISKADVPRLKRLVPYL
jgi:large subunit ribosomal protein L35